ncbi:MAG: PIG-L family deacetylase [Chloroflexi bacterium]|nr:PIG-L family deacetylase [Chloroflexota bacterium]
MAETAPQAGRKVLVVAAHPDDAKFGCGGTVARWVREGWEAHELICTSGDKGSHDLGVNPYDLAALREQEQQAAARTLGVSSVTFLRLRDGELEMTMGFRAQLSLLVRQIQPQVVITHDPWRLYQLHPDHRAVGMTTVDGIVAARDHLFFPEQLQAGLRHHRPEALYLFTTDHPNAWVDIAETIDLKIQALRAHRSQIRDVEGLEERIRTRAREVGEPQGMPLAEAFHRIELS